MDALVGGVEQEDERDDGMGGSLRTVERILGGADRLESEEDGHTARRRKEQETTAPTVDLE